MSGTPSVPECFASQKKTMGAVAGGQQAETTQHHTAYKNQLWYIICCPARVRACLYLLLFCSVCWQTSLSVQTFPLLQPIKVLLPSSGQNHCSREKILRGHNNKALNHFHSLVHSAYIHSSCYTWYESRIGKLHCSTYIRNHWLMLAITWSTVISLL